MAGWHFSQVTTLGIHHADGANATNGTPSFLEQIILQELSREQNVGAGERRTGPGSPHNQAWPRKCRIHSNGAAGLWLPLERVALVTGMLCMLGNKPWRREGEQIVGSEAHVGE
jgi:hypothetical protein